MLLSFRPGSETSAFDTMLSHFQLSQAKHVILDGGVIAYPTEAVYGLGCDPFNAKAVMRILNIKRRPVEKGLIIIASRFEQLEPFIKPLTAAQKKKVMASWPGPNTWLLPASDDCPVWLRGSHETIACRVTEHPVVRQLCDAAGMAIVSTSANRADHEPATTAQQIRLHMGSEIDLIISAPTGGRKTPSTIRSLDDAVIRQ